MGEWGTGCHDSASVPTPSERITGGWAPANKGLKQDRGGQEIQGTRNAHRTKAENAAAAWRAGTLCEEVKS